MLTIDFVEKGFRVIKGIAARRESFTGLQLIDKSVSQLNKLIREGGFLKARPFSSSDVSLYDLCHEIGCESGARFVVQIIPENELWQNNEFPALLAPSLIIEKYQEIGGEVTGLLFVAKRNSEPMMVFIEKSEVTGVMSSVEIQSRMMTLREGAQLLKSHFLAL